jgi:dsRNA-specific ribonuclease
VEAIVDGMKPARGEGGSKREAEQAAAQVLLKRTKRLKAAGSRQSAVGNRQ